MHYLFAVASGVAAGGLVGCAVMLTRRTRQDIETQTIPLQHQSARIAGGSMGTGRLATSRMMCYQTLVDTLVSFDDPELGRLTGWPHFFHEAAAGFRPTAYGTAYGLKLAMVLGDQDGRLDRAALTDTLWKLRRPDGGWASRTQGTTGRPEGTALVLGALTSAGCDATRLAKSGDVFESMLLDSSDTAMVSTYVVCTVLRELARIRPRSPRLAQLRRLLLEGAIQDPRHDNLLCWSARLDKSRFQVPSTAHTALAVVALARARQVTGNDDSGTSSAVEQAVRWLALDRSLENQTDQIRRYVTADHWESLTVGLFTAAWVTRALIAAEISGVASTGDLLDNSVNAIMRMQRNGIWDWDDGDRPIWMSYQGMSALNAVAISRWTPA